MPGKLHEYCAFTFDFLRASLWLAMEQHASRDAKTRQEKFSFICFRIFASMYLFLPILDFSTANDGLPFCSYQPK
jgi:hypothetical protein